MPDIQSLNAQISAMFTSIKSTCTTRHLPLFDKCTLQQFTDFVLSVSSIGGGKKAAQEGFESMFFETNMPEQYIREEE